MHSYLDAKLMAKALRQALAERKVSLTHSDCLELVAKQYGLPDWNTLAARIDAASPTLTALPLPRDWAITNQTDQKYYRAGIDPREAGTALVESRLKRESGVDLSGDHFASLMQSVLADHFTGERVKLSAELTTEDADAGSIWMRVDDATGRVLRFDNMLRRKQHGALSGTEPWAERSIILDVPEDAMTLHYGVILKGYGQVRARAFDLSTVDRGVPVTTGRGPFLDKPSNLDFSETEVMQA
ncbi:glyoxalase superfamily protein [Rhizobium panacihumi]|uniref:glyoxalase superfamily protein n=1 Tax=Rhizobium panacihumi TaxID=2008450 RepID=UPI003D7ACFF2